LTLLTEALESQPELRRAVQESLATMVSEVQSLSLFAEAGLPSVHSFPSEIARRIAQRILPSALPDTDARKLLNELYPHNRDARRLAGIPPKLFARFVGAFSGDDNESWRRQLRDLHEAMRLLAARISRVRCRRHRRFSVLRIGTVYGGVGCLQQFAPHLDRA